MTLQVDTHGQDGVKRMAEMMFCTNLSWCAADPVGGCLVAVCRTHVEGSDKDVLLRLPQGFTMLQIRDVLRTQGSQYEFTNTGTSVFKLTYASLSTPLTIEFQYSSPSRVTQHSLRPDLVPCSEPAEPKHVHRLQVDLHRALPPLGDRKRG
jgi:hypothetical protein